MTQEGLGNKYTTSWSALAVPSAVVTLEAQRKYGFFMSWSWCHHEKRKGEKEEEEKGWSQARTDDLDPGVQICSDTKIYCRTTCVTFGLYSLTTFSSCLPSYFVISSIFLTFWITNRICLFSSSPVSSLPSLPVNILLPDLSEVLYSLLFPIHTFPILFQSLKNNCLISTVTFPWQVNLMNNLHVFSYSWITLEA